MSRPKIVPELYCIDYARTLSFYKDVLGFHERYARPEERFAYLEREGAELMIEQRQDSARTFLLAAIEYPFGRGMHLQIEISDADTLFAIIQQKAPDRIMLSLEDRWYRVNDTESGNRQFVVADPDGYLLRFWHDLGIR